ncbi:N-acetyl-anhydromuranmyl-L-alanine amidase [Paenibacillus larvae subsp. larvae]|uniref:golvesin C-terminal-like domain-containing protein n=1 Tax=Paenibacillus larvae TaxID=1464 RepID=UPI000CE96D6F|nr:N-acetylmuramoyl-L-alanine amidase [Paenibacillus larvae]AVF22071.1 N-acetyl-anhydromuranmyl-L-alanine amidase [Paenibacillus larvae subsp. larvae]MCY9687261.1 N-acetylmuramoyl-L-alanine amidase [Paenibacillus larvae]MCY9718103.1 N-acetylmuramoyl-L-alanine amidase [Paenibacillus larvae]
MKHEYLTASKWLRLVTIPFLVLVLCLSTASVYRGAVSAAKPDQRYKPGPLYQYFVTASETYQVPLKLLLAVGYAETRWDDHGGLPSQMNSFGIMHLADNPENQTLLQASRLLDTSPSVLQKDKEQNILGAAAVLADIAKDEHGGKLPASLADWYTATAKYSSIVDKRLAREYADEIYRIMNRGVSLVIDDSDMFIQPIAVIPNRGEYESVQDNSFSVLSTDYPEAHWVPAYSGNYRTADRPSDGDITQMVRDKDIAYHSREANSYSIGIEHEGYIDNPSWYTDTMYRSSAKLTPYLCDKYGIPKDRAHIQGHPEIPGNDHTDPGPNWDWNYYMSLVNPSTVSVTVDNATSGRFTASSNWGTSNWSAQRYGADYAFAAPNMQISDVAWFKVNVPSAGTYNVYAWWPANSGYNPSTPFIIKTTIGNQTVRVDQTQNGGKWNHIGAFTLSAGDENLIGVSRWTSAAGYVLADL